MTSHTPGPWKIELWDTSSGCEEWELSAKDGHVIASGAGENAVLTVSTTQGAKLGLIFLEMKRAVEKISEIL